MKTTTKREAMYERIRKHGENLLAIFPRAQERDPVMLYKKLRRLESQAAQIGLRMCNGPEYREGEAWEAKERILRKVQVLLGYSTVLGCDGYVPVFIDCDPRGYALKIDSDWMRDAGGTKRPVRELLHRDWGGYGIIAPDLTEGE